MGWLIEESEEEFDIGDKVRIKYRNQEGYIIDKNGDYYMVSINEGEIVDSYKSSELEKCY